MSDSRIRLFCWSILVGIPTKFSDFVEQDFLHRTICEYDVHADMMVCCDFRSAHSVPPRITFKQQYRINWELLAVFSDDPAIHGIAAELAFWR